MKRMTIVLATLLGVVAFPNNDFTVYELKQMAKEDFLTTSEGANPNVVVKIPAGTKLPLRIKLTGDTVEAANDMSRAFIAFKRPVFFRFAKGDLLLSFDMDTWKPWNECFTGQLNMGVQPEGKGMVFEIGGVANLK